MVYGIMIPVFSIQFSGIAAKLLLEKGLLDAWLGSCGWFEGSNCGCVGFSKWPTGQEPLKSVPRNFERKRKGAGTFPEFPNPSMLTRRLLKRGEQSHS